jgi:CTP synthase (UTP-ammonia lyase)
MNRFDTTEGSTSLAVLGDRDERHLTHREIDAALALFPAGVRGRWVPTDGHDAVALNGVDALCLDHGTPFLGTCSGFQYACLALARRAGVAAVHAEVDPSATSAVIAQLACSLYGEERVVTPSPGTTLAATCGADPFVGFHYCGYGLAEQHERTVERAGAVIAARAPDMGVEAIELPGHPFFVATAFQPQVGASATGRLHPLLVAFARAAVTRKRKPTG